MPPGSRERKTLVCQPCSVHKQGCDKQKPRCSRCTKLGRQCVYRHSQQETTVGAPIQEDAARRCGIQRQPLEGGSASVVEYEVLRPDCFKQCNARIPGTRTRNRVPVSCARCRRLKVRCDRILPCGRCSRAGKQGECDYSRSGDATGRQTPDALDHSGKSPFHLRFLTRAHWGPLVDDIRELTMPHFVHQLTHGTEEISPTGIHRLSNFPFSERPGRLKMSRKALLSILPDRPTLELFIQIYLDTIEQAYSVLHVPTFQSELARFWDDPYVVNDSWLALLFATVSLGCHATATHKEDSSIELAVQLLDASDACLKMTPFMYHPDIANVQTLYLMVIFKQLDRMSCQQNGACWPLTGLIVRLAIMLGLHTNHLRNVELSGPELQTRKNLWTSIVLLEMRQSLLSGMPLLLQLTDFTYPPGSQPASDDIKATFAGSVPVITRVLSTLNLNSTQLEYDKILEYDLEVRRLLKDPNLALDADALSTNYPARLLLNVFYRRMLLALHTIFAQDPHAWAQYPVSYWSTLDSCLGLLAVQRELCEHKNSHLMAWFSGLFREDFFAAAMTLCHNLVTANSPLEPSASLSGCVCQRQARATILETLVSCSDLWAREEGLSICHREAARVMKSVTEYLQVKFLC
ncbi:uncharacterized protein BJX67DRAFT_357328 [Aspergillus lucknowensis]|uniref:Zn(2)-C6 fungal-type domain-containing protein n=1 Tax=Aspergillus lucknowensis TaxID=176173 RepID=A0ABR4LML4_9EURO